ncbi:protein CpxP [Oxalobacteraceae bacterium GrIS 1.11]
MKQSSTLRSLFSRNTIAAFFAGAVLVAGVSTFANGDGMGAMHHAMAMDGRAHSDRMLQHFYVEIDATEAQKAHIDPLVKQALTDLLPLHEQLHAAHSQLLDMLSQGNMDRGLLEASRLQHVQLADQASKRLVQLIADVGDTLTPAQRQALAAHLTRMQDRHHF